MEDRQDGPPEAGAPGDLPGPAGGAVRVGLPLEPGAVHRARVEVADLLSRLPGVGRDAVFDAQLAVAELVANAVRHAGTTVTLELSVAAGSLTVGVCDGSAVVPVPRRAGGNDEDGRGLAIVSAVSQEWGVESLPAGHKRVWARVRLTSDDH